MSKAKEVLDILKEVSNAWLVYLNGKLIDTVFSSEDDAVMMKKSLVDHDGYDPNIEVKMRESVSEAKLSPALQAIFKDFDSEVDVNDAAVAKILNDYESEIEADPKGAMSMMSGDFYGAPPSKWYHFYMELADVMGWDTDF